MWHSILIVVIDIAFLNQFWWPSYLQYRHLIPAPVDKTCVSAWLYKHLWISCQTNNPSTSMTSVDCEPKFRSVVRTFKHPCSGNWMAIGRAVVRYVWAAHALSAGIKCRHCRELPLLACCRSSLPCLCVCKYACMCIASDMILEVSLLVRK